MKSSLVSRMLSSLVSRRVFHNPYASLLSHMPKSARFFHERL